MPEIVHLVIRHGATRRRRRRGSLGKHWKQFVIAGKGFTVGLAAKRSTGYLAWTLTTNRGHIRLWGEGVSYSEVLGMKRKRAVTEEAGGVSAASVATTMLGKHQGLIEHMAVRRYDDGQPRTPGRMMLETVGSMWKLTLKDPDTRQQLFVLAATIDDAITMAALLCEAEDAPWEPDPWAKDLGPKKSRK